MLQKIKIYILRDLAHSVKEVILNPVRQFTRIFRALLASLVLIAPAVAADSPSIGKVRYILGEVSIQKKSGGNWNPLRIGLKVRENDLIRTLIESEAGITLPDGSLITIEENTTVFFKTAVDAQSKHETTVDIQTGRVFFDVQKQSASSKFLFRTGTATAAIRGTNGFVDAGSEGIIVSLESGKVVVTDAQGKSLEVNGGETLVEDKGQGLQKFKTPSSGSKDLATAITAIRKGGTLQSKDLEERARGLDSANAAKIDSLSQIPPCYFDPISKTTNQTEIFISGKCRDGATVQVNGLEVKPEKDGTFKVPVNWEKNSFGQKRIRVRCGEGSTTVLCREALVAYAAPTSNDSNAYVKIESATYGKSGLEIRGSFFSEDPKATVEVAYGALKPAAKNSDASKFVWAFPKPSDDFADVKAVATLKTSKKVLSDSFEVRLPLQFLVENPVKGLCEIRFSLKRTYGQKIRVEETIDGIPTTLAIFEKDAQASFPMLSGKHSYKIIATEPDGNRHEFSRSLTCKE